MLIRKYVSQQEWEKLQAEKARLAKEERKLLLAQKDLFEMPDSEIRKNRKMARYY